MGRYSEDNEYAFVAAASGTRDGEAEAVLAASRVLVAVSVQSIASVEDVADLTQVRALLVVASRGSATP